jgi:hypothetical protein
MQQYTWAYINDNIYYMYTSKRILLEDTKCNYKNKEQSIVLASNTYLFSLMVYHGENDLHFDEMMMMMSALY